jgi:hypothetical protein
MNLPRAEDDLDSALGDAAPSLVAEEWRRRVEPLPAAELVGPERLELAGQSRRQEHVTGTPTLCDLGTEPDTRLHPPVREVHVAHVQAHDLA